ncbi:cytochrome P450 [Saccharothrix obliqua]|uniref:cytochrome P450 n=1 Tax=Saccharothrix obliqua TaxID=2861747 RepID=UPI001C5F2E41|nr:cytochrome P450 [Saccharothrix obliqua]MBW4722477.1 cytochrome P450 [Saccharothrix obliqua]
MTTAVSYPFGEPARLDPEPEFATLRAERPVSRVRLPFGEEAWLATRYEDVRTVLGDPRFSRAAATGRDEPRLRPAAVGVPGNIMALDPPDHTRLRRLVMKAFTVRRVERLRVRAQEIADELVDAMVARGHAELVEDFAVPLPTTVICELLGVPVADRDDFRVWSDAFLSTTRYTPDEVREHVASLSRYMAGLIARRRESPTDDLIGALVVARDEEDRLSEDELLALAMGLLVAGHETTASQIPNFVHTLLTHPDQLAVLRADLDLVPRAVEELMRYVPLGLGAGIARYAVEDVELSGVLVRAGEPVLPVLVSANRDETAFPDADRLDLRREPRSSHHVGFGHGAHHCLGAPLARMELQVALDTLLRRLPGLRFAGEVRWKEGMATRGPAHLPLTWDQPA